MPNEQYQGVLFIGDPHLASRVPGFRCDDYPRKILNKLNWCLQYAREQALLPAVLGDVFHLPRDNANWLLAETLALLDGEVLCIYGNHDCATNELGPDDSLQVLLRSQRLRLIDASNPWRGQINSRPVVIGGTSWGQRLPAAFESEGEPSKRARPLVLWMTHHDVRFAVYEASGRFEATEIPGIDLVVNGHIHTPSPVIVQGATTWMNPGNIARLTLSDGTKARVPAVLRIDIDAKSWSSSSIEVPHEPFDKVFHADAVKNAVAESEGSLFVSGLNELRLLRTQSGAGLSGFLKKNIDRYPAAVQAEIMELAKEVVPDGKIEE